MNNRYKYPRTPHLKWSPGRSADDVELATTEAFEGEEVVVTVKLDGENTTIYRDYLHARSLDTALERNVQRERQVPEDVIRRLMKRAEPPTIVEAHSVRLVDAVTLGDLV